MTNKTKAFINYVLVTSLFFLCQNCSYAQDSLSRYLNNNYYSFNGLDKYMKDDFIATYKNQLGLTDDDDLIEQNSITDDKGRSETRYQQYYKGYLVEGSSLSLHADKGVVLAAGGNLVKNLNVDIENPISEATALTAALSYLNASEYYWQDSLLENGYKELSENSNATYYPKGNLVISIPQTSSYETENFQLAWKFQINTLDSPNKFLNVYVNALTGNIISSFDRTNYGYYATGNCLTEYDGSKTFRTYHVDVGINYHLHSDHGDIRTSASRSSWTPKDQDNNWSSWAERPTVTAHWSIESAYDYFGNRHNYWGSDGNSLRVYNYAQQNPNETYVDFGDFAASRDNHGFDEIISAWRQNDVAPVALDVLAHEYTHRFIAHSSNLNPFNQWIDAGALNEGFADIFGINAERYIKNVNCDWTIGEDIASPFPHVSVRDFADPHNSTHPQAARYQESGYWDNFTTTSYKYKNAGVLTHWFYLLSQGGYYNGIPVSGIGIEKAEDIAFVTMMWWVWGTATFPDMAHQSLAETEYYYGKCSFEWKQVCAAWRAVGLYGQSDCRLYILNGPHVVNSNTLDGTVKPVSPVITITDTETDDPSISASAITWHVPSDWTGVFSEDNLQFTLTSVSSTDSKEIWAEINYGGDSVDTVRHIIHFVQCDDPDCLEGANKQGLTVQQHIAEETKNNVFIYPNPVKSSQSLQVVLPYHTPNASLQILDIQGREIKRMVLTERFNTIQMGNITPGIYLFKIKSNNFQEVQRINIF